MKLISLVCVSCGAPLQVPANAQFITCQRCQCHMAVKHNSSAAWTERIEQIDRRTQQLAEQMAKLQYENEVARLDREWMARPDVQQRFRWGRSTTPSRVGALVVLGIIGATIAFVVFAIGVAASSNPVRPEVLAFPLVFLAGAIVDGVRWRNFAKAHASLEQRKQSLHWRQFLPSDHPEYLVGAIHDSAYDAQAVGAAMGASMTIMAAQSSEAATWDAQHHAAQQHAHQQPHTAVEPAAFDPSSSGGVAIPTPDFGAASGSIDIPAAMPDMSVSIPDFSSAMPSMDVSMPASPDMSGSMSFGSDASGGM